MAGRKGAVPPDYPQRIKELRARLGLTQVRLAELLNVSFASVNRWENGQARPSPLAWGQLAAAEQSGITALASTLPPAKQVRETRAPYDVQRDLPPTMDFAAEPEAVRAVAEAERLACGHLYNPAFAI